MNSAYEVRPIPEVWSDIVHLNVKYKVLLCLSDRCNKAVSARGLVEHIRRYHDVKPAIRRQIERYTKEFKHDYNYATIPIPENGLAPQPIIPIVDGYQCRECSYITQSDQYIRRHANKDHEKKRTTIDEICTRVRLQTWFRDGKERYWVVDESKQADEEYQRRQITVPDVGEVDNNPVDGEGPDEEVPAWVSASDPIAQEIRAWEIAKQEHRATLLATVPADEWDPWLRFTGWNTVLQQSKHDLVKTHAFSEVAKPEEPQLCRLMAAWGRILERCLDTLASVDHKDALKWWKSPKNEVAHQHPFELHQNSKSVDRCSEDWQRFICYAMRTAPEEEGGETGK
ncbi:hypothetical protein F5884DRAFT_753949 [Xylogone sp. PMI_703]|nr:hypothetical protein F5884DRAFT_759125 [Xylogone sp. PMI_703]KAH8797896.1 hypothetical protein F5884DRAFT_870508 [Xylogone sp. PMI_703]KAH8797970.1 hypothetical protein F5884DRAFT_870496 [Xylogone sp. PMI_703]KAH8800932.1 hypothetical protein F5884DRAFT_890830 [Xylogone sp. PMI_703]KAH8809466.1 hypothetical protein F5884DRAFT_753949 [Xylogone sp. PMI_703]